MPTDHLHIRQLGRHIDYQTSLEQMRRFTDQRDQETCDEFWLLEHAPVFTLGQAGRPEHLLAPGDIPVVNSDRGGQVTYHGPGQSILYLLVDLRRRNLGIRSFVTIIEQAIIDLLATYGIPANSRREAPGVYVGERKIAALGLRVRRGCSYHGLSLNIDLDLSPFSRINPCGYAGLEVTRIRDLGVTATTETINEALCAHLIRHLGYTSRSFRQN